MAATRFASWLGVAALVVGVLWASHGAFEMLQPLGRVTQYQDPRQRLAVWTALLAGLRAATQ